MSDVRASPSTSPPATTTVPAPARGAPSTLRRVLRGAAWSLLALGVVMTALVLWLWRTPSGTTWLLGQVPGLVIEGAQGTPHGGPFAAQRVTLQAGGRAITIEDLSWRDLRWVWRPGGEAWVEVQIDAPQARRVNVGPSTALASTAPAVEPMSLRLPARVRLDDLQVGTLQIAGAGAPITDLRTTLHLGAGAGAVHRIEQLQATRDGLQLSGGGSIGADAPFKLDLALKARKPATVAGATPATDGAPTSAPAASAPSPSPALLPSPAPAAPAPTTLLDLPWDAQVTLRGPLARPRALATLRGGRDGQPIQLDLDATLAPFAAWPLAALLASTTDLDLAAIDRSLPRTQLTGRAQIDSSGLDAPMRAQIQLRNAMPGGWHEGRLPLRDADVTIAGRADARERVDVQTLSATLAGGGSVSGRGVWDTHTATLEVDLRGVSLPELDARAPAMTLAGPVAVKVQGLPAPTGASPIGDAPLVIDSTVALQARLHHPPQGAPAQAALRASVQATRDTTHWRVALRDTMLSSGGASASGIVDAALAQRDGAWTLAGKGELTQFDPAVWWTTLKPGTPSRPHRLNGRWQVDLGGPAQGTRTPLAWLAASRGAASLDIGASTMAGVPLSGQVKLAAGSAASLDAALDAAGNTVRANGRLVNVGGAMQWQANVQAPALAALAPIASLHPALASVWPQAGSVSGELKAEGAWPGLSTRGSLQARGVRAGDWRADQADLRWQLAGLQPDAPLEVEVNAAGLAQAERRVDTLRANVTGTLTSHRFSVDAASPLRPPAWLEQAIANRGAAPPQPVGTSLTLRGDGRWQPMRGNTPAQWRTRVSELRLHDPGQPQSPALLAGRDLAAVLGFNVDGGVRSLQAEPGQLNIVGATLRWRDLVWQPGVRIALDAELDPVKVAPVLSRLYPDLRFGGDLTIGATAQARQDTTAGVVADVVIDRRGGDLTITDDAGTQALGLTDLRVALAASGGTWHFTQAAAGSNLGVLAGAQTMRIARDALWPAPTAPLQGVLEWRVEDLGVWATFAPPGWRLGGRLHTSASLGGTFGAPEITGRMTGEQLVARNLLEGVYLTDGTLDLSLRGTDARIETFRFKGGDGELRLEGGATFGAEPRAQLRLLAERFQLLGRFDRRIVASGQADVTLAADSLKAEGRFTVDEGLIDFSQSEAPSLDSDVVVIRRPTGVAGPAGAASAPSRVATASTASAATQPRPAGAGPLARTDITIEVDLGERLRLRGRGIDTGLRGRLVITTPGNRLAVNGTVRTDQGTYAAYGQKLQIERGVLRFAGAVNTPTLDIRAVRPNLDVSVGVAVTGTAANPRVRLFSEPEMSDMDKISWLVLGRAPDGLGRTDTALLQRAALALLAGDKPSQSDRLLSQLGIDELSVRQEESGDVRDTVITLGKQLSQRWYVGYEYGINSTSGTWQLIYRVAQRFTLRARSGDENALDAVWTWRWDEPPSRQRTGNRRRAGAMGGASAAPTMPPASAATPASGPR